MSTEGNDEIVSEALEYRVEELGFRGHYVRPVAPPVARRAVIIAPDWRGLSGYAIGRAKELARLGHDVLVADLYGGGLCATQESEAKPLIKGLVENRPDLTRRMQAATNALIEALPQGTSVVALGYSIGGMALLDLGRSGAPLAGIVLASALLRVAEPGKTARIAAPVLVLHGTRDVVCPMDVVTALATEMDAAGNKLQMVLYGQTGHAFYNPEAGTDPNARLVYSPEADRLSRQEILRFLARCFSNA